MTQISRRTTFLAIGCLAFGAPVSAALAPYVLDQAASNVGFEFSLNGIPQSGSMPVQRADIFIDARNLSASTVDVTLNVSRATTGLIFATQALVGTSVLNAASYPTITFTSRSISLNSDGRLSGGARVSGLLTMRGVSRDITLNANLYRTRGSAADDLSNLTVRLDGQVSRSAFGASGFPDLVDDLVTLDITAVIRSPA